MSRFRKYICIFVLIVLSLTFVVPSPVRAELPNQNTTIGITTGGPGYDDDEN